MELALIILSACFLPVLIWSIFTGIRVQSTFSKYDKIKTYTGATGFSVARVILDKAGLNNVEIKLTAGKLSDHYDPRDNVVYLSEAVYRSTSVAALGVAAHEVGHAIQYATNYKPVKMRTTLVPLVSFTSKFSMPLLLISLLLELMLGFSNPVSQVMLLIAIIFYGCYAVFTLVTLPVEYNASRRAKKLLVDCGALTKEEVKGTAKVLSAAAQTYLAAFLLSIIQIARLLLIFLSRRNRS